MKKKFICYSCGKEIENTDKGMLEWYDTNEFIDGKIVADGFRIVHNNDKCTYDFADLYKDNKSLSDRHLYSFDNMSPIEILNDLKENYYISNENMLLSLFQ